MNNIHIVQSNNPERLVSQFHHIFNHPIRDFPSLNVPELDLRGDLIAEEFNELENALIDKNIVEVADALADLVYVIYGAALVFGIDLPRVLQEVHNSNMSKLNPDTGRPIYREDGKVLKGSAYTPPNIARILGL